MQADRITWISRWRSVIAAFALVVLCFYSGIPAFANSVEMQKGLAALNAGKYSLALGSFELAVKAEPSNVQVRYCLAVCYHYLGRTMDANRDYAWVCANTSDPDLLRRAKKGLSACRAIAPTATSGFFGCVEPNESTMEPAPHTVTTAAGRPAGSKWPAAAVAPTAPSFNSGTPKVVDVYTTWCHWCKVFEPKFEEAQNKYSGRIEFERINAELPENKEFCQMNSVRSFPTVLLFDGSGNLVDTIKGCPKTFEIFEKRILTAFPSVR